MNKTDCSSTLFIPQGRASAEDLHLEINKVANSELVATLLDAMPDYLLVLNEHRQIVTVNRRLMKAFDVKNPGELLGLRPGEALDCVHSNEGPDGCGSANNCVVCGAVIAILASQNSGLSQQRECHLLMGKDNCNALDLDVLATQITVKNENFTVVALRDISSEKRRYVMERVFFHDILNNAGGIRGLASLLLEGASPAAEVEYKSWMVTLSDNMIEEINHQQRLLAAERGTYKPNFEPVNIAVLLQDVRRLYEHHERVPARKIVLDESPLCTLVTDAPLLRRIVGNMVLNAMEAGKPGDTISISSSCSEERARISVTNPGEIQLDVQLQLFNRSFSTKGESGRGLGTYSMKLFGERYLGGEVGFSSGSNTTTFFIDLPLTPKQG